MKNQVKLMDTIEKSNETETRVFLLTDEGGI
jgi:hypothetical protein